MSSSSVPKSSSSPVLSWKNRITLAIFSFSVGLTRRPDFTVNRRLVSFFDPISPPIASPGISASDMSIDPSRNLWFRLYTPIAASAAKLPVVVYFHGGGFAYMAANSKLYDQFCRPLARELPAVVLSVNYRLSPEYKFPAQYEDGFDALKFIDGADCLPESADLERCFLAGDSAGGNIAHHVALRACNDGELRNVRIRGLIATQPFFGGEERTESEMRLMGVPMVDVKATDWMWKAWLPEGSDRDHPAANVFGPKAEDISGKKFPSTIVFVGGFDPLQDWQKRYYEGLKRSGKEARLVEYPKAIHGFYGMADIPESKLFMVEVRNFVKEQSTKIL